MADEQDNGMDFSAALQAMRMGHSVRRDDWIVGEAIRLNNEKDNFIDIQHGMMRIITRFDLLATDWELAD